MAEKLAESLLQARLDALSAIHLHGKRVAKYQRRNLFIEFLSIAVPTFYLAPRYLLKGTAVQQYIEPIGELLGSLLLVLAILKVVFKWQDLEIRHLVLARKNTDIAREADQLLRREYIGIDVIDQFLKRVSDVDEDDREHLGGASKKDDQEAYRIALRQLVPSGTICRKCGANPNNFTPGRCDVCGGSPPKITRNTKNDRSR